MKSSDPVSLSNETCVFSESMNGAGTQPAREIHPRVGPQRHKDEGGDPARVLLAEGHGEGVVGTEAESTEGHTAEGTARRGNGAGGLSGIGGRRTHP